jgi:hypothetical protein
VAVHIRRLERDARRIPSSVEKLALMYARHGIPKRMVRLMAQASANKHARSIAPRGPDGHQRDKRQQPNGPRLDLQLADLPGVLAPPLLVVLAGEVQEACLLGLVVAVRSMQGSPFAPTRM